VLRDPRVHRRRLNVRVPQVLLHHAQISGDLVTVKVVFATKLARYIRERLWHPSQKFRDLTDGRLELTLHVADTLEVRRWILGVWLLSENRLRRRWTQRAHHSAQK